MVLNVSEVSGGLDRYHGDFEGSEGFLRPSNLGESFVGGMAVRSKRSAVCSESASSSCGSTTLHPHQVPSVISTSPSKPSVLNASSKPIPIAMPKKHNPYSDKGQFHTWIDAMRAQSPPHTHSLHGDTPEAYDLEAAHYKSWRDRHPSALALDKVIKSYHKKQIVVFLDYDGTLSPIVEDPERAFMSVEMRATVKEVASCFPTAVISGRSRPKVYEFVQLAELYYAGSHGMDIMGPAKSSDGFRVKGTKCRDTKGNDVVLFQPASEYLPLINKVTAALLESTKVIKGAKVENNKFCVSVHFRRVKEELWEALAERVGDVLKDFPSLSLTHGRKVLEVRPSIAWDKGRAVDFLLKSLGFKDTSDVIPLYLGDDKTDEDAFKMVNETKHGCSILVSSVPKRTAAKFSLQDPSEVMEFLRRLVHWYQCGFENRSSIPMGVPSVP